MIVNGAAFLEFDDYEVFKLSVSAPQPFHKSIKTSVCVLQIGDIVAECERYELRTVIEVGRNKATDVVPCATGGKALLTLALLLGFLLVVSHVSGCCWPLFVCVTVFYWLIILIQFDDVTAHDDFNLTALGCSRFRHWQQDSL